MSSLRGPYYHSFEDEITEPPRQSEQVSPVSMRRAASARSQSGWETRLQVKQRCVPIQNGRRDRETDGRRVRDRRSIAVVQAAEAPQRPRGPRRGGGRQGGAGSRGRENQDRRRTEVRQPVAEAQTHQNSQTPRRSQRQQGRQPVTALQPFAIRQLQAEQQATRAGDDNDAHRRIPTLYNIVDLLERVADRVDRERNAAVDRASNDANNAPSPVLNAQDRAIGTTQVTNPTSNDDSTSELSDIEEDSPPTIPRVQTGQMPRSQTVDPSQDDDSISELSDIDEDSVPTVPPVQERQGQPNQAIDPTQDNDSLSDVETPEIAAANDQDITVQNIIDLTKDDSSTSDTEMADPEASPQDDEMSSCEADNLTANDDDMRDAGTAGASDALQSREIQSREIIDLTHDDDEDLADTEMREPATPVQNQERPTGQGTRTFDLAQDEYSFFDEAIEGLETYHGLPNDFAGPTYNMYSDSEIWVDREEVERAFEAAARNRY